MRVVQQAVHGRAGHQRVAEHRRPFLNGPVGGDHECSPLVPETDDLIEVFRFILPQGAKSQIVHLCAAAHKSTHVKSPVMCSWLGKPASKLGFLLPLFTLPGGSQALEPIQNRVVAAPAVRGIAVSDGSRLRDGGTFRFEIYGRISVRGFDARMTKPVADGDEVDAGLQEMDCGCVPHRVGMDALGGEGRSCGYGKVRILAQYVADPEPSERLPALVPEKWHRGFAVDPAFVDQRLKSFSGLWPQWAESLFSTFSTEEDLKGPHEL